MPNDSRSALRARWFVQGKALDNMLLTSASAALRELDEVEAGLIKDQMASLQAIRGLGELGALVCLAALGRWMNEKEVM